MAGGVGLARGDSAGSKHLPPGDHRALLSTLWVTCLKGKEKGSALLCLVHSTRDTVSSWATGEAPSPTFQGAARSVLGLMDPGPLVCH